MSDYSWKEMMAVLFSREIKDTDKVTSGAHTEIFFAATMLAQKTHAPNMKLQLGGSVTLCNVTDVEVSELPASDRGSGGHGSTGGAAALRVRRRRYGQEQGS